MDAQRQEDVVAAIGLLAEKAGGSLAEAPSAEAITGELGAPVTAEEATAGWEAYGKANAPDPAPPADPPPAPTPAKAKGSVTIRNNCRAGFKSDGSPSGSPVTIGGVTIPFGAAREVPGFDAKHGVIKAWLKAGVIEKV